MQILPVNNNRTTFQGVKVEFSRVCPAMRNHMMDSLESAKQREYALKWCNEILSKLNKYANERVIEEVLNAKSKKLGVTLKSEQVWPSETKVSIFAVHRDRNNESSLFGADYEELDAKSKSPINMDFYLKGRSGSQFIGTERDILRSICPSNGKKLGGIMGFVAQFGAVAGNIMSGYGLDEEAMFKNNFEKFITAELEKQPEYQEKIREIG